MGESTQWEITVTGTEGQEWQGFVRLLATGERWAFRSLLEMLRILQRTGPGAPPTPPAEE